MWNSSTCAIVGWVLFAVAILIMSIAAWWFAQHNANQTSNGSLDPKQIQSLVAPSPANNASALSNASASKTTTNSFGNDTFANGTFPATSNSTTSTNSSLFKPMMYPKVTDPTSNVLNHGNLTNNCVITNPISGQCIL